MYNFVATRDTSLPFFQKGLCDAAVYEIPNLVTDAETISLARMASAIRALSMDAVEQAQSGHPGMPMGFADVATVLWSEFINFDPEEPTWPDRDRVVLSAGHGSMLLYSILYLTGYEHMTLDQLKRFRQLGAITAGHPEADATHGIETTTGPLGQGIANGVGMALAERILAVKFDKELVDHTTYVIAGDGCMMEGISHEAASLAGHLGLNRLIVLYDDNKISIDGPTSLSFSDNTAMRFESYGWNVLKADGHNYDSIREALVIAKSSTDKPTLICFNTKIAHGAPTKAGTAASHGAPLGAEEIKGARVLISWPHAPFDIPGETLQHWRSVAKRGQKLSEEWQKRFQALPKAQQELFQNFLSGDITEECRAAILRAKEEWTATPRKEATRKSSGAALGVLMQHLPSLVGGSADLSESNGTFVKGSPLVSRENYGGRYIHYGVRELGMAAMMNGMALHGGVIPYGGTFLVFTDYARPAIRLSALMKQRVIYVMTHDSIGLGEDGPTHQPVEHLAALRAIPNLWVMRPADAIETLECWELAVARKDGPSVLVLSRQNVEPLRTEFTADNRSDRGGYVLQEAEGAKVTLLATGTEVMVAAEAAKKLAEKNIAARVVSIPCFELFDMQSETYRSRVLGDGVRVGIEAAVKQGWERYLGDKGFFIGMEGFGASAPAPELYKFFGITADAMVRAVEERI